MSDSKSNSFSSLWMFLIAILGGAFVLHRVTDSGSKEPVTAAAGSQAVPTYDETSRARDQRLRAPLRAYFGLGEESPTAASAPQNLQRKGTGTALNADLTAQLQKLAQLDFLIVTVADPVDSAENYRFDLQLDALHKALAANSADNDVWVLDRYYLPWQAARERKDVGKGGTLELLHATEPGVLLYRRVLQPGTTADVMGRGERLLLVYLVGELPTSGLHKRAFRECLDEIRFISSAQGRQPLPVMIAGPTFTGSTASLAAVLRDANETTNESPNGSRDAPTALTPLKFRILTGSALGINRQLFDDLSPNVMFGATVTTSKDLRQALLDYIRERNFALPGLEWPLRVAWLNETGTGFSASQSTPVALQVSKSLRQSSQAAQQSPAAPPDDSHDKRDPPASTIEIVDFPYPLHISRVRTSYERRRAEAKSHSSSLGAGRITVPIPFEAVDVARDLPGAMTPNMTAATVDVVLAQILDTIRREGIRFVGITATDIRDPIFLADVIRDHCPDVQLLLITPDLLHGHPEYHQSLSGALVASSYPFFSEAQDWSFPFAGSERKTVVSNQGIAGLYNATLLLRYMQRYGDEPKLEEILQNSAPELAITFSAKKMPPLVCYDLPLKEDDSKQLHRPPVWISLVGTNGLWPVASVEAVHSRQYALGLKYDADDEGVEAQDGVPATRPIRHQPRLSGRLAPTTTFARGIAPLCVLLVALAVWRVLGRDKQRPGPDWAYPLAVGVQPLPAWTSPALVTIYLLTAVGPVWIMMTVAAGHSSLVVFGSLWVSGTTISWLILHTVLLVLSLLASYAPVWLIVGRAGYSAGVAVVVWLAMTGLFVLGAFRIGIPTQRAFLQVSSSDILNGISLLLPGLLVMATCASYGYTKLKHIALLERYPTKLPAWCSTAEPDDPTLDWHQPFVRSTLLGWLTAAKYMWGLGLLTWCSYLWISTVNVNPQPAMFNILLLGILTLVPVAWGWLLDAYATVAVFRALLKRCVRQRLRNTDRHPIAWDQVFARRELVGPLGLGGLLSTPRPRDEGESQRRRQELKQHLDQANAEWERLSSAEALPHELVAPVKDRQREAQEDLWAFEIERFVRQYFVHLRTMAAGLTATVLLLFLTSGSFPFNTANLLRLTTALLVIATAVVVIRSYVTLDRDEFLSRITGTEPHHVHWDWSLLQNAGVFGLLAVLALISQTFPEIWQWLRTFSAPLMRSVG